MCPLGQVDLAAVGFATTPLSAQAQIPIIQSLPDIFALLPASNPKAINFH
jgi:hypothetical protein